MYFRVQLGGGDGAQESRWQISKVVYRYRSIEIKNVHLQPEQ